MNGWHSIDTAPKDGTPVLLAHKRLEVSGNTQSVARFISRTDGSACWAIGKNPSGKPIILPVIATHWMHLPADPPEPEAYVITWTLAERTEGGADGDG